MKHRHAEFIKAWADDPDSVQYFNEEKDAWFYVSDLGRFGNMVLGRFGYTETRFRYTQKSVVRYYQLTPSHACCDRFDGHNVKAEFVNDKLTSVELLTEGGGK